MHTSNRQKHAHPKPLDAGVKSKKSKSLHTAGLLSKFINSQMNVNS